MQRKSPAPRGVGLSALQENAREDELVLGDLGDGAGRAGVKASAAGHASIAVGDSGNVLELENAGRAGVDADTAGDALVSINDRMSHGNNLLSYARCQNRRGNGSVCSVRYHAPRLTQPLTAVFSLPFTDST